MFVFSAVWIKIKYDLLPVRSVIIQQSALVAKNNILKELNNTALRLNAICFITEI